VIPFEPAYAGRYWDDRHEVDWLLLDQERKRAVAVELKWTRAPISAARTVRNLKAKIVAIPALDHCEVSYILVSRSGFQDTVVGTDCRLISLGEERIDSP
jgi:hypothetical protein